MGGCDVKLKIIRVLHADNGGNGRSQTSLIKFIPTFTFLSGDVAAN